MAANMNQVVLEGRLTRDPDVRYSQGENPMAIARSSLAVNRPKAKGQTEETADFISLVAFRGTAEIFEKYTHKGSHVLVSGRIQTGSYTNKDGVKVYTTDVLVNEIHLLDTKGSNGNGSSASGNGNASAGAGGGNRQAPANPVNADGFMNIPDGLDEELPFN